jgi:hypothetical protein
MREAARCREVGAHLAEALPELVAALGSADGAALRRQSRALGHAAGRAHAALEAAQARAQTCAFTPPCRGGIALLRAVPLERAETCILCTSSQGGVALLRACLPKLCRSVGWRSTGCSLCWRVVLDDTSCVHTAGGGLACARLGARC